MERAHDEGGLRGFAPRRGGSGRPLAGWSEGQAPLHKKKFFPPTV